MVSSSIGKILVVDDEVELKNILVEALASQGYETAGFTSGAEALAVLRGDSFDVLLTDLMMPGMDGITLVKEGLQIDPHLICIMMTGQGTIQTAVDAMKQGAFDYVLKPFRLQTVLPVLTRAMNARHLRLENLQLRDTVAIYELAQTIAFTLDPQSVINKLADAALQQTGADEVSVLLPVGDGRNEMYVAAVRGENRQALLGERVALQESISGWVARQREPLILDGEINDTRFRSLSPHPEIRSAISVPMQVASKLVGTININALSRPRPFTLGQMKALTILASTAGAALESASLYEQVRQAEADYRSIFENAGEGIFRTSPTGQFITANPAMANILGYESPQALMAGIADVRRELYADSNRQSDWERRLQQGERIVGFEAQYRRKDGSFVWLSESARAVFDESGAVLYYEGIAEDITARKQAEEAVQASERKYRDVFAFAPVGICQSLRDGTLVTANQALAGMLGYDSVNELLAVKFGQIYLNEDDRDRLIAAYEDRGYATDLELQWKRKDGPPIWVQLTAHAIKGTGGLTEYFEGFVRDITERKRAEAELRESEERYRDLVENSLELITTQDMDGQILSANRAAAKVLGYEGENYAGKTNLRQILAPEVRDLLDEYLARIRRDGVASGLMLVQTKTGEKRIWEYYNTVRTEGVGTPIVRSMARDITERKRAESALRESEERYRDLVENAHDIIFSHDLKGNYTSVNRAAEQITGYTREECLRLNITDTIAPEHVSKTREMMAKKLAGEKVTAYEVDLLAKDGKRIAVEVNTKLVLQDGVPVGVQGIARDVTERKHLEDQLRQSQKLEGIGQLAGGIAHDFNNLLTAINGYSSLALQRIEGNASVKTYLEEIKKAGDRAANLTRQLLAFGRKQILQPLPLSLNDIVTDMSKMLQRLIGEDIQLSAKLTTDLKRVKADPGQIEQVLVNLIVNARDAMPQGGKLTIETANTELDREYASTHVGVHPGAYVVLAVSDTGTGMDEHVRQQIFEPFFTTKEKGKGTGLGLSTVYGIVKQSGGNIWVYSEPNHGTTFKVYLPALASTPKSSEVKAVESPIPGGSETVLLVEDEEVVRGLARQILEEAGYRVLVAPQGEEAIRLCIEHAKEIHLLLTDVVMPGAGGKEVADRLASLRPGIKVLFMSGYTDEAIVHHGVLDPNVKFIQKPFSPAALARKVREVLDSNGKGPVV
jgi:two-component system cell cycle sensor histidine kinase/response regulator CckA